MSQQTQLDRYKLLVDFINKNFKEKIKCKDIEAISFYSYRNINRIFQALQQETIGQYIKRLKLEKAAEYLKYSTKSIMDIAIELDYSDQAAFSKAFKNQFDCSPSSFRDVYSLIRNVNQVAADPSKKETIEPLQYVIEELPAFDILYLEYKGASDNLVAIEKTWTTLEQYANKNQLINSDSIFLAEILDDDEITEIRHCRYNAAIVLEQALDFELKGFFKTKKIARQKYAKFIHRGSHESCEDSYKTIYSRWMFDVQLEFVDLPTIEFYLNDPKDTLEKDLLIEIYIPVAV